jgi:hypothetical protein
MYKIILSIEHKGRIIKLLKKANMFKIEDNKDIEFNNLLFVKEQVAIDSYNKKVETVFAKENNV